jgi:PAS domain S-box-containing protein
MRDQQKSKVQLIAELKALRQSVEETSQRTSATGTTETGRDDATTTAKLNTVRVPEQFAPIFLKAQDYVSRYFSSKIEDPQQSTISISGERYILVRAASMSVEFFELVRSLYQDKGEEEAWRVANNLLFDVAHAIGKADARSFRIRMNVTDPIERLSAGPIHFSYSGWAFVNIFPESNPSPDENYYLIYDHPFSFESDAWLKRMHGAHVDFPVCIMNAGYSSGWCEESFEMPLVAAEVECLAKGDAQCRFIMAPPARIEEHVARYLASRSLLGTTSKKRRFQADAAINVPEFFQRKRMEDELHKSHNELELRVRERTAEVSSANQLLLQEISERVRAQQELQRANERFELASAAANSAVYETDLVTGHVTWTRGLNEVFGYTQEEVAPTREWWQQHIHPEDLPRVLSEIQETIREGADFLTEYRFRSKANHYLNVWDKGRLVRDKDGTPVRFIGALLDMTERKRLENALRQAQKMEAIGRLAGGVAHDFNNLLTVIKGFSELLARDIHKPATALRDIEEIQNAADRAAGLTKQLLAFSRQQMLSLEVLSLEEVVINMGAMLQRLLGEDVELKIIPQPNTGKVRADRGQLEQVIMNLAINARDAMPDGGILTLELSETDLEEDYAAGIVTIKPGRYVMLVVRDCGQGMDDETQAHIFEPFFTTKSSGRGTGLGLATVYGIVKQIEGYIWVQSAPGKGSSFTIHLPRAEEEPGSRAVASPDTSEVPETVTAGETILLAEDESPVRSLVCEVLSRRGYTVIEARDPREALRLSAGHPSPIHLLVTDIIMPYMNGRELARTLQEQRPGMEVLYISGYTGDVVKERGMLEPGSMFLQKPFTNQVLARKVYEILERKRKSTAIGESKGDAEPQR